MSTREHPITKKVIADACLWATKKINLAQFCRSHQVSPNTAYRMIAASLAQHMENKS